ncbi:MAG: hypothetical protein PHN51_11880 [Candidatus Nanopelagicales bacterium]|nr:hypothetical protein [Candidatus Nanopelagicales bacterium]
MKIVYIKLEDYKRFPLSEKTVFEHRFTKKLVMLSGPNGSGKSSLMYELTSLPSTKDRFGKNGYKEIHIEFNGSFYILISSFKDGVKYSFLKDGQELNKAGLITAQKDLVFEHFKISSIVHDIMVSRENFTTMGLIARKKLLNAVSHINIDTVLGHYNGLKETLKNHTFMLKNQSSQLLAETQKLNDEGRLDLLRSKKEVLVHRIEGLLDQKASLRAYTGDVDIDQGVRHYQSVKQALDTVLESHSCVLTSHPYVGLPEYIGELRSDLKVTESLLTSKYTAMEDLDARVKSAQVLANQGSLELGEKRSQLLNTYQLIVSRLVHLKDELDNLESVRSAMETIRSSLPSVLENLCENPERKYSQANYQTLLDNRDKTTQLLIAAMSDGHKLDTDLKELEAHQNLQCPNCSHSWLPEEVKAKTQSTKLALKEASERQFQLQQEVKALTAQITAQSVYLDSFNRLTQLYGHTKLTARVFWDVVQETKMIYLNPGKMLSLADEMLLELEATESLKRITEQVAEYDRQLTTAALLGDRSVDRLAEMMTVLEAECSELRNQRENKLSELKTAETALATYKRLEKLYGSLDAAKQSLQTQALRHTVNSLVSEIDNQLSLLKVSVLEVEKELAQSEAVKATVDTLRRAVAETQENVKVLEIMLEELSPKNGFIAKTVSSFLNVIITSINTVISENWSYKMELKAINVEEDALDYKFRVIVKDKLPVDDISLMSGGMQEIVNLAMKFTLVMLMRLQGYPAYMDEFGLKLDKVHRAKVASIIFQMLGSSMYSQIFLITHLDMEYGEFHDAEVIEM